MKKKSKILFNFVMTLAVFLSACTQNLIEDQNGSDNNQQIVVEPSAQNELESLAIGTNETVQDKPNELDVITENNSQIAPDQPQAGRLQETDAITVQGWLGAVYRLPDGAQYDDKLVLFPEGTGELGISGATSSLEAEIKALRDKKEPGKYAHFWGKLTCPANDVNGCQLLVEKIRVGAANTEPEAIDNWEGQLMIGSFNGGTSFVFVLNGKFPMQYSIAPTGMETQAQLEEALQENAIVKISGTLMTGIPDVNGSRITPENIEVIGLSTKALPSDPNPENPLESWVLYTNENYGYSISHPQGAILTAFTANKFPAAEVPEGMDGSTYLIQLMETYGNDLCVRIEYGLGFIAIHGSPNLPDKYVNCGRGVLPTGTTINEISEMITVGDMTFTSKGYLFTGESDSLVNQGEAYRFTLPNGIEIEYGSVTREDASFADYDIKGAQSIRLILETLVVKE